MSEVLLFHKLPSTLFSPLAAPEALLYSEVLLALFGETQRHQEPLSHEFCVMLVTDVIEDQQALETIGALDDEQGQEERQTWTSDARGRAGTILRYLLQCKWLREEIQENFTVAYIIPDYAFRILGVLQELKTDTKQPLQGLICAIHDLLQAAVQQGNVSVRVPQAYQETMRLLNGLKELQHNINVQIETILKEKTLRDILEQTFASYLHQVTRRAYHELRTTDHVSRFRPGISTALSTLMERHRVLAENLLAEERQHERQPTQKMLEQLEAIRSWFDTLDELLGVIDTRHSLFFDSAVRSIEHQLRANTSTSGHLRTVLEYLLASQRTPTTEQVESTRPQLHPDELIQLYSLALLDEKSLMAPRRPAEPFVPGPDTGEELSEAEKKAAQEQTLAQLSRALSRERVKRFAQSLLAQSDERRLSEVPLNGPDDLPLLIYLRLYGTDGTLGYRTIEVADAQWVECAEIGFRDFLIQRVPLEQENLL